MPRPFNKELIEDIGVRMADARKAAGLTQAQLADAIGIEPVTLSRYETGTRSPSLTTVAYLAAAVGVSLGDLLDRKRPRPKPENTPEIERALRLLKDLDERQMALGLDVLEAIARH